MLRFLFGKSSHNKDAAAAPAKAAAKPAARPAAPPAPVVEAVPVAVRLAELAARPDGDPAVLEAALASGPAELREAALARLQDPVVLARVASDARSADARHAAVQRVNDEALLAQIAQQVRTRDKRVYKVARDRLDGYARERERRALQVRWLETVETLAAQDQPDLTRVMEVERVWAALQPDAEADARFQLARAQLHARFHAQAEERRQAKRLASEGGAPDGSAAAGAAAAEAAAAAHADQAGAAAEASGLAPAAAAGEVAGAAAMTQDGAAGQAPVEDVQGVAGIAATAGSAAGPAARSDAGSGAAVTENAEGAAQGQAVGTEPGHAVAGEERRERAPKRKPEADPALREKIAHELEALEHALEEGHLHDAETRLATLSELQSQAGGVAGSLGGRIRRAVEEIARLRAWRRWGGQQARDHLCDAAEALPSRELPAEELGRAIKALRTQWQSIASSEGGAPQHLWERFDAACEKAWEPVREHFAKQAERRTANLQRREAMLVELEARVALLDTPPVDWKAMAFGLADASRRWHTLGPVDRKLAKPMEARYAAAIGAVERRLRLVREGEAAEREALIRRAEQLAERSEGRDVVTRLRELQTEWQTRSRAVPLERAREQALWERFRTVCDGLFQARDAARAADDAERAAHLEAEAAAFRKRSELWRGLREAALACAAAEHAVLAAGEDFPAQAAAVAAQLQSAWQALPDIAGRDATPVQARQQRLMAVCEGREPVAVLQSAFADASDPLAHGLLELEISLGLPSPAELQDARRRMQLEKLADALRSGGRSDHDGLRRPALAMCALPAPEPAQAKRLDAILESLAPKPPERRPAAGHGERQGRSGDRHGHDRRPPAGERGQRSGRGRPGSEPRGSGAGRQPDA